MAPGAVSAAELVLHGVYQGKDIYVQNPYSKQEKEFCTLSVFVNDREVISNPTSSAYRISFSHLAIGDIVVIKIHYREGCTPRIVNPDAIQPSGGFEFLTAQADRNAVSWLTRGEMPGGKYLIERKAANNEWQVVKEVTYQEDAQAGNYATPIEHRGGENIYRIKYEGLNDVNAYSVSFSYTYKEAPITFYPVEATRKLYLSEETDYLITDATGKKYKRGRGRIITIHNLKPGEYYLNYQERSERFVKKEIN
jgi:hypothetical protein